MRTLAVIFVLALIAIAFEICSDTTFTNGRPIVPRRLILHP
jgi:hypothetical protein